MFNFKNFKSSFIIYFSNIWKRYFFSTFTSYLSLLVFLHFYHLSIGISVSPFTIHPSLLVFLYYYSLSISIGVSPLLPSVYHSVLVCLLHLSIGIGAIDACARVCTIHHSYNCYPIYLEVAVLAFLLSVCVMPVFSLPCLKHWQRWLILCVILAGCQITDLYVYMYSYTGK